MLDKRIVSKAKNRLCRESKLLEWLGIAKLLVFGVNPVFFSLMLAPLGVNSRTAEVEWYGPNAKALTARGKHSVWNDSNGALHSHA